MTDSAHILAELRALRADVAELRDEQQHLMRRSLPTQDRRDLAIALPVAYGLMATSAWTAAELAGAAIRPAGQPLLRLLAEYDSGIGGLRSFGRFLTRCDGLTVAGLRLVRVGGAELACSIYQVQIVSPPSKPSLPLAAAARAPEDVYVFASKRQP